MYSTPGLLGDLSVSSEDTSMSPSTPLDGTLLSPANLLYGPISTLGTPGRPVTPEASAYMQLARRYQQMEHKLTKEREERASLK
jgi:hypothetical protein